VTSADTFLVINHLLHVLAERCRPMSTEELAEVMPWKVESLTHGGCELWCRAADRDGLRVLECHETWHVVAYRRTGQGFAGIYRHLRSLERRGLVRRHHAGRRRVLWALADEGALEKA
jgi:hypothetical protein